MSGAITIGHGTTLSPCNVLSARSTKRYVMTECPTCGRTDFKSPEGMKYHHARVHGESLRTVTSACEYCGEEIERPESVANKNEKTFCGNDCQHNWRDETGELRGVNHPNRNKATYECKYCGKETEVPKSKAENCKFCSRDCYAEWQSENLVGEQNPHWLEDSKELAYGSGWRKKREERLEKDDHKCVVCGKSNAQEELDIGRGLSVHHIEKARNFLQDDGTVDGEKAHRIENLITLCTTCHNRWEGIPLRPQSNVDE